MAYRFNSQLFDEDAILAALPPSMRREISAQITKSIVEAVPIFRDAHKVLCMRAGLCCVIRCWQYCVNPLQGFLGAIMPLLKNVSVLVSSAARASLTCLCVFAALVGADRSSCRARRSLSWSRSRPHRCTSSPKAVSCALVPGALVLVLASPA